jgi:hypothetical protein
MATADLSWAVAHLVPNSKIRLNQQEQLPTLNNSRVQTLKLESFSYMLGILTQMLMIKC